DCGFVTREEEVSFATFPKDAKLPAGAERFPLWYDLEHEMQAMDMPRQILEGKPYPIKSLFSLGMNARMWPNTKHVFDALESLDFFVDCDLFLTDTAKYADIVLPSCSSFERGEFKPYPNGYATYTKPAIKPLYEAKPDTDILCELAKRLNLPDELLKSGYREYTREIIRDLPITIEDLEKSDMPIKFMQVPPREDYAYLKKGLKTPTGKYEFKSERIASHPQWGLDALPTYVEPMNHVDAAKYPFILNSGGRIPNALHSRFHLVPSARSLRPEPMADMSCDDAEKLQIKYGDDIIIYTERGEITVKANPTITMPSGTISMYHGYSEADVNLLMDENHLDPYSGFPAFRSTRCAVRKKENV
ncbi:MAG: molybdopterin dinucleotide binding domain-containing protein, partial [Oscillospiraceae bacterium]